MKKLILLLSLSVCFLSLQAQSAKPAYTIVGKIEGLKVPAIYMKHHFEGKEVSDTAAVVNGVFKFQGNVDEPSLVVIYVPKLKFQKVFYVDNVPMQMTGKVEELDKLVVSGCKTQAEYDVLEKQIADNRAAAMDAYYASEKAKEAGDTVVMNKLKTEYETLFRGERGIRFQFAKDHPKSYASLNELLYQTEEHNLEEAKRVFDSFAPELKNTVIAQQIRQYMHSLETIRVGKPSVDFTQNDVNGKPVKLSSYKGKYVLVEFWASWCGPCRAENPNLREGYVRYKDKGLDILGISLDDKIESWKTALKEDNLPWEQVSDLKGNRNEAAALYGVHGIPANFLINPNGTIIAKDLRGDALNKKLEEIFGK